MTVRFDSQFFNSTFGFWFDFLHIFSIEPSVNYYIVKSESRTPRRLQIVQSFVRHFVLLGKNVALLPPLENFQIRQTMCDMLIVTFSNMAANEAIVNPPASFRSAVWKYYGFPAKDGSTDKSKTICKICSATLKYCAGSTSSMSAHLKRQHESAPARSRKKNTDKLYVS